MLIYDKPSHSLLLYLEFHVVFDAEFLKMAKGNRPNQVNLRQSNQAFGLLTEMSELSLVTPSNDIWKGSLEKGAKGIIASRK